MTPLTIAHSPTDYPYSVGSEATERRARERFRLQVPIVVSSPAAELIGTTRDVSAGGVFFYADWEIQCSSRIDFTVLIPSELTLSKEIRISCRGKVIRVEPGQQGTVGIVATIDWYEFERTA